MAAKKSRKITRRSGGLRGLGGSPAEHADRMRDAVSAGNAALARFKDAINKRGACRTIGNRSGAAEELMAAAAESARAHAEAAHAGARRDQAVNKLEANVDGAYGEFISRCVRVAPDID